VIKADLVLFPFSVVRRFAVIFMCLLFASVASATAGTPVMNSGRWQFNILQDSAAQIALMGDSEIYTYLRVDASGNITLDPGTSFDYLGCDTYGGGLVNTTPNSNVNNGVVTIGFPIVNPDGTTATYTFNGTLTSPNFMTGTVSVSTSGPWAGGTCQYLPPPGATFEATWLPNLDSVTNTFTGTFTSPLDSNQTGAPTIGPDNIQATLVVNSDSGGGSTINGSITINPATPITLGATNCLTNYSDGTTVKFQGLQDGSSQTGMAFQMYGTDGAGVSFWVLGYSMADPNGTDGATNPNDLPNTYGQTFGAAPGHYLALSLADPGQDSFGMVSFNGGTWGNPSVGVTNSALYMQYGIGGACQAIGFDRPFMPVLPGVHQIHSIQGKHLGWLNGNHAADRNEDKRTERRRQGHMRRK
jgi:hypothetical protein